MITRGRKSNQLIKGGLKHGWDPSKKSPTAYHIALFKVYQPSKYDLDAKIARNPSLSAYKEKYITQAEGVVTLITDNDNKKIGL